MSRGVNQVKYILLPVALILHLDGMTLNGNTALALKIHIVKHLSLRNLNGVGTFQQTVCQR